MLLTASVSKMLRFLDFIIAIYSARGRNSAQGRYVELKKVKCTSPSMKRNVINFENDSMDTGHDCMV